MRKLSKFYISGEYISAYMEVNGIGEIQMKQFSISDALKTRLEHECLIELNKRLGIEPTQQEKET